MFTCRFLSSVIVARATAVLEVVSKTSICWKPHGQKQILPVRQISCTKCRFQDEEEEGKKTKGTRDPRMEGRRGYIPRQVDVQSSIRYMESEAYRGVYKDEPVWKPYRRNQKGQAPIPPRKTCIRGGMISTGSACPVCRDDYLVLDYRNLKLLKQFISDVTGEPLNYRMTGLCLKQIRQLELELAKARDYGYLEKHFPYRKYDYNYYHSLVTRKEEASESTVNQSEGSAKDNVSQSNTSCSSSDVTQSTEKPEVLQSLSDTQTDSSSSNTVSQPS